MHAADSLQTGCGISHAKFSHSQTIDLMNQHNRACTQHHWLKFPCAKPHSPQRKGLLPPSSCWGVATCASASSEAWYLDWSATPSRAGRTRAEWPCRHPIVGWTARRNRVASCGRSPLSGVRGQEPSGTRIHRPVAKHMKGVSLVNVRGRGQLSGRLGQGFLSVCLDWTWRTGGVETAHMVCHQVPGNFCARSAFPRSLRGHRRQSAADVALLGHGGVLKLRATITDALPRKPAASSATRIDHRCIARCAPGTPVVDVLR